MIAECKETRAAGGLTVELQAGLSAAEADKRVAQAHRAGDIGAMALAFYLADMAERGVHQELGFHGIEQYAEIRYQIRPSTTRRYLIVGRALRDLPEIHRALGEGRLFWSQVRELVRVAVPETEAEWIEWARNRSAREITAQVRIRRKGERSMDPARRRIHNAWFRPDGRMNALQWAKWNSARAKLEAELGRPVTDTEMFEEMSDLRRAVLAARRRGENAPHILLAGPPGLGKTSLAHAIAGEMGVTLKITSAPLVGEPEELLRHLVSLRNGDILFLDETHRLPARVAETLYEAMEDGRISHFGETRPGNRV